MRRIELGFEREGRGEEMEYTKSTDNSPIKETSFIQKQHP